MSETEIQAVKQALLAQRSTILNNRIVFEKEQREGKMVSVGGDEAEFAAETETTSLSYQLAERDRQQLILIDKALGKISDGTYGECESCGQSITLKRLIARPFATMCVSCQEDHETLTH